MKLTLKKLLLLGSFILGGLSPPVWAEDKLQLVMTGTNRAIVLFNGERLVLSPGDDSHPRVNLIEASSSMAILSIDGERVELDPNSVAAPVLAEPDSAGSSDIEENTGVVTLWADPDGFFFARGTVNRRSTRFLVDTGADTITFSSAQADRLGIDYKNAKDGFASTASGIAPLKSITLDRVSVEGITLRNVAANVILGSFPEFPLLGGSFLNKLNMSRSGKKMELSRR
jgi:aspartyl protease family protein